MAELWAVPLGVDFAAGFVEGFLTRFGTLPPEDVARITIFANSQRMKARLGRALVGAGLVLLPRLRVVSDLAEDLILADLPPQAPALRRRLQIAQLIRALIDRAPQLAPASAVQGLTDSLFALMEEMDSEGVEPAVLEQLDVADHAAHWDQSLRFLRILVPFFAQTAPRGAAGRQRLAALRLAELWGAQGSADPVIVAGSTASRGATSVLMEAVARLQGGYVVLPGFDFAMPAPVWAAMADRMGSEDHPQTRFLRLCERLDLAPGAVRRWTGLAPADPARNAVLSLALRPAPVTDQWLVEGAALTDLPGAMAGVTLIEAASPREEAQALALILREAAERGEKAALITPDRLLARRVTAALDRWGLRPDDSAGRPLDLSAPGRLLRLIADLFCDRLTALRLLVLLKHPLVMTGEGRGPHLLLLRDLELELRRKGPVFPRAADLARFAETRADGPAWAAALAPVLEDLEPSPAPLPLEAWVARHRRLAETLCRGMAGTGSGTLWSEKPGEACREIMDRLAEEAAFGGPMSAADYRDLVMALLAEGKVQDVAPNHPGTMILGAREAREAEADLVILAGLTEGTWPGLPAPDPWLNRPMRQAAGLLLPERQIGLAAHDFQQAAAAKTVVLSRSLRSDEAETVAARWLNRLINLLAGLPGGGGPRALTEMRARGGRWLDLARRIDRPGQAQRGDPGLRPATRPSPVPPPDDRPRVLTLTEIETLIRNPYAIYARRILRLRPLDALLAEPDAGDRGTVFHRVLELFARERPEGESLAAARARLMATAEAVFAERMPFPVHRALWLTRLEAAADSLLIEDRRAGLTVAVETEGKLEIAPTGVLLKGRLDRADRDAAGRLVLIDFKTGRPPSEKEQAAFAKQLLATAVLVERGGFGLPEPLEVGEIRYVGIAERGKTVATDLGPAEKAEVWQGLVRLLSLYMQETTGFTARRALMKTTDISDYDHLSRFGEWDLTQPGRPERMGDADAG
jgi:double-strand break repair protein AddB